METVLVVGATGNIGTAAVIGALIAGHKVLAIVRNADSATKLLESVGSREGITTIEANVMSDTGVQSVVDQVKAGKLPSFQHVYAAGMYLTHC
jgi:NAD(P)-dependent dehydrogenase (short-subunit alcohol dehydrogenase family)